MVVFDTSVLAIAFDAKAAIPLDPTTGLPISQCSARVNLLLKKLAESKARILIPTPVIAEYIVSGGADKEKRLQIFTSAKTFMVAPFDLRAAIECALIEDADTATGRLMDEAITKAKVKFDRQIIAIALANNAETIYTGDKKLAARAKLSGLGAVMTWELPPPPVSPQGELPLDPYFPEPTF